MPPVIPASNAVTQRHDAVRQGGPTQAHRLGQLGDVPAPSLILHFFGFLGKHLLPPSLISNGSLNQGLGCQEGNKGRRIFEIPAPPAKATAFRKGDGAGRVRKRRRRPEELKAMAPVPFLRVLNASAPACI